MSVSPGPLPPTPTDSGLEFHVLIRGLKLDQATRDAIDAAIRSAVLKEIAAVDQGAGHRIIMPSNDPQTRSIFESPGKTLGLILEKLVS